MRAAYAILGLAFAILFIGGYFLIGNDGTEGEEYRAPEIPMFTLTSPSFREGGAIPIRYTCDGAGVHPPLAIDGAPAGTVSFALIMHDPDIPQSAKESLGVDSFDHWVLFNIPAGTSMIREEGDVHGIEGRNTRGNGYVGPCPPDGEHRYFFTLYALDTMLPLDETAARADVEAAIDGHVLKKAELMGVYTRTNQ